MTNWLSDEPNKLPHYATHYVAVAGSDDFGFQNKSELYWQELF